MTTEAPTTNAPTPDPLGFPHYSTAELLQRVGPTIKDARQAAGWGILAFAVHVGVNKETMRRIETGKNLPRLDVAHRICKALDLDPAALLATD